MNELLTQDTATGLTPLQTQTAAYIAKNGLQAFMDEDYNLAGTRVRAVITEENVALAIAMGIPVPAGELPVALVKDTIHAAIDGPRRDANRLELARFFANPANLPELSRSQRMFLEWHYLSPNNYQLNLEKPLGENPAAARILGWNRETEVPGTGDFVFYTGLLGCTGLCAVAEDGAAYMSHWDEVCNPRQTDGYARFAASHPGGAVYLIGAVTEELSAKLRASYPELAIAVHHKKIYFETTYTVRFTRENGQVKISFQEANVTDDYVQSAHNGNYGRWFPYGRFSQAYPAPDDEFQPCTFVAVK